MVYAQEVSRLLFLTRNHRYKIDIMSEAIIPVKPTATSTPCACAGAAKAQPTAAPAAQPKTQPVAAPAPAAPKAGKLNARKH
jgi:hypothetical protein